MTLSSDTEGRAADIKARLRNRATVNPRVEVEGDEYVLVAPALLLAAADYIRDLEEVAKAAVALTDGDEGDNQHRCDVRCDDWSSDPTPLPPCSGVKFRTALSKLRTSEGGT